MIEKNFNDKIQKLEVLLNAWSRRYLSLKGKITIIQTLGLTQLLYVSAVLHVPEWVVSRVNNMLVDSLRDNKKPKIKVKTVIGKIEDGGLKMPHFSSKVKAMKLLWIRYMLDDMERKF